MAEKIGRPFNARGGGIALIFARTETQGFHREIWNKASGIFFFEGRLSFWHQPFKMLNQNSKLTEKEKIKKREKNAKKYFKKSYNELSNEELTRWVCGDACNAPSCLVSYSQSDNIAIAASGLKGKMIWLP